MEYKNKNTDYTTQKRGRFGRWVKDKWYRKFYMPRETKRAIRIHVTYILIIFSMLSFSYSIPKVLAYYNEYTDLKVIELEYNEIVKKAPGR